jgi:hypothetical protein
MRHGITIQGVEETHIMRYLFVLSITILTHTACINSVNAANQSGNDQYVLAAEKIIDAFYSFDSEKLKVALESAKSSISTIVYYQGWAKGGNYKIVNRMPCEAKSEKLVSCSITVKDDLIGALGIEFNVTDTFEFSSHNGKIIYVKTRSNDPQLYRDANSWVKRKRPELIREPCRGYFAGGPTPGKCAQAMAKGFAEFAASEDFPK